jgi:hypothetical protein
MAFWLNLTAPLEKEEIYANLSFWTIIYLLVLSFPSPMRILHMSIEQIF